LCYANPRLQIGVCFLITDISGLGGMDNPATYAIAKGIEDVMFKYYPSAGNNSE
jgi:hypothetical protein